MASEVYDLSSQAAGRFLSVISTDTADNLYLPLPGPYEYGGAFYLFTLGTEGSTDGKIVPFKSTDGGRNWVTVDEANGPAASTGVTLRPFFCRSGNTVTCVYHYGAGWCFIDFDLTTETFGTAVTGAPVSFAITDKYDQQSLAFRLSDGTTRILYNDSTDIKAIDYTSYWGTPFTVVNGDSANAILDGSDQIHLFYRGDTAGEGGVPGIGYVRIFSDGTIGDLVAFFVSVQDDYTTAYIGPPCVVSDAVFAPVTTNNLVLDWRVMWAHKIQPASSTPYGLGTPYSKYLVQYDDAMHKTDVSSVAVDEKVYFWWISTTYDPVNNPANRVAYGEVGTSVMDITHSTVFHEELYNPTVDTNGGSQELHNLFVLRTSDGNWMVSTSLYRWMSLPELLVSDAVIISEQPEPETADTPQPCYTVERKAPGETIPLAVNAVDWLETGDTIVAASWSAETGLTVDGSWHTDTLAACTVSGGTEGTSYVVTATITTSAGRTEVKRIELRVVSCTA